MSTQPEKPKGDTLDPRPKDAAVRDLELPPLTPDAEAKVKAGLASTDELKGFTSN